MGLLPPRPGAFSGAASQLSAVDPRLSVAVVEGDTLAAERTRDHHCRPGPSKRRVLAAWASKPRRKTSESALRSSTPGPARSPRQRTRGRRTFGRRAQCALLRDDARSGIRRYLAGRDSAPPSALGASRSRPGFPVPAAHRAAAPHGSWADASSTAVRDTATAVALAQSVPEAPGHCARPQLAGVAPEPRSTDFAARQGSGTRHGLGRPEAAGRSDLPVRQTADGGFGAGNDSLERSAGYGSRAARVEGSRPSGRRARAGGPSLALGALRGPSGGVLARQNLGGEPLHPDHCSRPARATGLEGTSPGGPGRARAGASPARSSRRNPGRRLRRESEHALRQRHGPPGAAFRTGAPAEVVDGAGEPRWKRTRTRERKLERQPIRDRARPLGPLRNGVAPNPVVPADSLTPSPPRASEGETVQVSAGHTAQRWPHPLLQRVLRACSTGIPPTARLWPPCFGPGARSAPAKRGQRCPSSSRPPDRPGVQTPFVVADADGRIPGGAGDVTTPPVACADSRPGLLPDLVVAPAYVSVTLPARERRDRSGGGDGRERRAADRRCQPRPGDSRQPREGGSLIATCDSAVPGDRLSTTLLVPLGHNGCRCEASGSCCA